MLRKLFCMLMCLALCGCGILSKEPYRAVNYFDFACKGGKQYGVSVSVTDVTADMPYSSKMVFRISENRVEMDEFNRWAGSPAELVRKYLTLSFEDRNPVKAPDYVLKAEIMQIEGDLSKPSVKLMLYITVRSAQNDKIIVQKTYHEEIAVEKVTGESFAKGIEAAMDRITGRLADDVLKTR